MRVTVIPSDNTIIVDGVPLVFPFAAPSGVHAIQWYGTHGVIEYAGDDEEFTRDVAVIQPYVVLYNAEVSRLAAEAALPPPPAPVPSVVTMRQARLALLGAGLLASVDSAVAAMSDAARIEWEYAATVDRSSPLVDGLRVMLALTTTQLDNLFATAATL